MSLYIRKEKRANGRFYYKMYDVKRVKGKVRTRYVGYLGKDPRSKSEITFGDVLPYVTRLMDLEVTDAEIREILRKIGIDTDISPITKIVIENDRKMKKTFLRIR